MWNAHFRTIFPLRAPEFDRVVPNLVKAQNESFWWQTGFCLTPSEFWGCSAPTARKWVFPIYPAKVDIKSRRKNTKLLHYLKIDWKNFRAQIFQISDFFFWSWWWGWSWEISKKSQIWKFCVKKNFQPNLDCENNFMFFPRGFVCILAG